MCLAVPGKVESIWGDEPEFLTGKVDFAGLKKEVSFAFVPEVQIGDYVLVHVGMALQVIDPKEAQRTFEALKELGELDELGEPERSGP
jgi:hydrogenase expression/formation protein HypC